MAQSYKHSVLVKGNKQKEDRHNQNVFQPIEIGLNIRGKKSLSKIQRTQDGKAVPIEIPKIDVKNPTSGVGEGLISLLQDERVKPIILVCITVYAETRNDLNTTLDGILSNLDNFKQAGIQNHQVVVVVIYDGIDRINNDPNSNENNMLKNFSDIDRQYNIKEDFSLNKQYDEFKRNLKHSKLDINKMRKNGDLSIFKTDSYIKDKYQKAKAQTNQENILDESALQYEFLEKSIKEKAIEYLNNRKQTAWLYQCRKTIEKFGTDQEEMQKKMMKKQKKLNDMSVQQSMFYQFNKTDAKNAQHSMRQFQEEVQLKEMESAADQENYLYMFHCVKHTNGGKLNSHLWFFEGFCELFQPKYTVLVDCGLVPQPQSIFDFYLAMETDLDIGGVCGFMGVRIENVYNESGQREDGYDPKHMDCITRGMNHIFDIQKAQMFEYNFAHIIDKPFESLFGFIHVLPGAFSGYRWDCLKRNEQGISILSDYLKTVKNPGGEMTIEEQNMYLAEDRILCLKIYTKPDKRYKLRYIPTAHAIVDPVTTLVNLMGQRKRWINGTYFALSHVLENRNEVYQSEHSCWEMFWFKASMYYAWMNQIVTFCIISIFISSMTLVFSLIFNQLTLKFNSGTNSTLIDFNSWFAFTYIMLIATLIFYSLHFNVKNPEANYVYYCASTFLGMIILFSFGVTIYFSVTLLMGNSIIEDQNDSETMRQIITVGIALSFGSYVLPVSFNMGKVWELIYCAPHYVYFSPAYLHTLIIYAFCRIDDLSWGTKGLDEAGKSSKAMQNKWRKYTWVVLWVNVNTMIAVTFQVLMGIDNDALVIDDGEAIKDPSDDKRMLAATYEPYNQTNDDMLFYKELSVQIFADTKKEDDQPKYIVRSILIYVLLAYSLFQLLVRVIGAVMYYAYFYLYFVFRMRKQLKKIRADSEHEAKVSKRWLDKFFDRNRQQ